MAPADPAPSVSLRSAVALAGRFPVLAGVDLSVAPGEVVLLQGANGAGKTSLLRLCAGLLPLTTGSATVLGLDLVRDRSHVRRRVGMLGHASFLYDDLTVTENVRFAVRAGRGTPRVAGAALERVGLTGRVARTPAARLSAGQRRRVALAVLVARAPELWLLDEPHAGLDAETRTLVGELLREAADAGSTVLVSSHEPELVEPFADRAAVLSGGRVVAGRVLGRHVRATPAAPAGDPGAAGDAARAAPPAPAGDAGPPVPSPPLTAMGNAHVA